MIGLGVLKGLGVTLKTFIETFPPGRAVLKMLGMQAENGLVTIQYPDEKQQHAERFRYFPFLVYDKNPEDLRCVSCKICEQECPPACIHIVGPAKDEQGRPLKVHGRTYPVKFAIDVSICMSCRICVDVCPFDAIEMDNQYELSSPDRFGRLIYEKEELLKSAEYFKAIKPEEAAVVDQRLAAKLAKTANTQTPAKDATKPNPPEPPKAEKLNQ